jgi:hypothetical protein
MKNKNSIDETEKFRIGVTQKDLKSRQTTSTLANLQKQNPDIEVYFTKDNSSDTSISDLLETGEVIEPQDQATIKYLSNVKDTNTGEISKPFTIDSKNYQMVRGLNPNKEVVMAVYCFDDMDDAGNNLIHPVEYFEENVVKPVVEREKSTKQPVEEYDYAAAEREYFDKEDLMNYLNLRDLEGYKHFFVNINTGEIVGKFNNYKEMMRSGIKLGPEEDYMGVRQLKSFRAGEYFKEGFSNANKDEVDENVDISKLKGDVKILIDKMTNMFGKYFAKLDTPVEQSVFLAKIGQLINVPIEKLPQIISSYKELAKDDPSEAPLTGDSAKPTTESRIITKKELLESIGGRKVIKKVKVKDIK